eukprot:2721529-Alexandrium_andersonii.AAC.1
MPTAGSVGEDATLCPKGRANAPSPLACSLFPSAGRRRAPPGFAGRGELCDDVQVHDARCG